MNERKNVPLTLIHVCMAREENTVCERARASEREREREKKKRKIKRDKE